MADTAAAAETRTVEAVASTGAAARRDGYMPGGQGYGPYIEELPVEGVDTSRLVGGPVLIDHQMRSDLQVGVIQAVRVETGKLITALKFSLEPRAQAILRDVRDGIRRAVSVGYSVETWERRSGDKRNEIPIFRAVRWTPIEISVVPAGLDPGARFRAASATPDDLVRYRTMTIAATAAPAAAEATGILRDCTFTNFEPSLQRLDDLAAERQRTTGILRTAELLGLPASHARLLISEGTSLDQARTRLQDAAYEAARPTQVSSVGCFDHAAPDAVAEDVAQVLAHRLHPQVELTGRAKELRGLRASQLIGELLRARNVSVPRFASERDIIKRAGLMTTSDLPLVLGNSLNKALLPQFEAARSALKQVARIDRNRDFRSFSRHRVGEFPGLLAVAEHGEYTSGAVGETRESATLVKHGRILGMSYEMLVNDEMEALSSATSSAASAAATLEADKLATAVTTPPLMSDGVAVFHSSRANLSGTSDAISVASVGAGKTAMRKFTGLDGTTILNTEPRFLVVSAAKETIAAQVLGDISPAVVAESNSPIKNLQLVVEPRLDASSATAWYLFGSPATTPTLTIVYLDGEEGPVVETREGFEIDGVQIKVRFSCAAFWADFRAWKNPGA